MSFSKIASFAGAIAFASKVAAHGHITGIVADGVYYEGYDTNFQYMQDPPVTVGWSIPEDQGNGFIAPDAYASSDIICHLNATNAQTSATVAAGGSVNLQWTEWPSSHHGPVIDYLANCGDSCATVDKTTLEFFKIDGVGLVDDTTIPGTWGSDQLIANNNSWTVTIPTSIAPGNYVLRHEIIALHSAGSVDGAQNYPFCVNLEVTGSGTDSPTGTLGTALYTETDPGIEINIYSSIATYTVPGPALYTGAASAVQSGGASITATGAAGTATSAASQATSAISSASAASITASASVAPYSNGTSVAVDPIGTGSSSKPTSCKKKAKTTSAAVLPTTAVNVVVPGSSTATELTSSSSAAVETTSPSKASSPSAASPSASSTSSADTTAPSGTTLGNLLSWLSSFYESHKDTTYTDSTLARRHARDVLHTRKVDGEVRKSHPY